MACSLCPIELFCITDDGVLFYNHRINGFYIQRDDDKYFWHHDKFCVKSSLLNTREECLEDFITFLVNRCN